MRIKKKRFIILLCCFSFLFICLPWNVKTVDAGISEVYLENTSGANTFSSGNWIRMGNCCEITANSINMQSTSSSFDKVVMSTSIKDIHEYILQDKLVLFDAKIGLSITETTGRFAFNFGLLNIMSNYGSANSSAIWFSLESGTLYVGLSNFSSTVTENKVIDKTSLGAYSGSPITIELKAERFYGANTYDNLSGSVSCGSKVMNITDVTDCVATGFMSFSENVKEATTYANISECTILTYQYRVANNTADANTPATVNFDSGYYNINEWYTEGRFGCFEDTSFKVIDGKLKFINTATSCISTKLEYSNFALSFDVSDIQKTAVGKGGTSAGEYNPKKTINEQYDRLVSPAFYVVLGCLEYSEFYVEGAYVGFEPYTYSVAGDKTKPSKIDFTKSPECTRVIISNGSTLQYIILEDNFWQEGNDTISINISLIDCVFTLKYSINKGALKTVSGIDNFTVQPYGYIKIGAIGYQANVETEMDALGMGYRMKQVNMALDNISLYNHDSSAKAKKVNYDPSNDGSGKDYNYIDTWDSNDLIKIR